MFQKYIGNVIRSTKLIEVVDTFSWAGTGLESLFDEESSGCVGGFSVGSYDQVRLGSENSTGDGIGSHGTSGLTDINVDGPTGNVGGHWLL